MNCPQCGKPYKQDTGFSPDCNCAFTVTTEIESIQLVVVLKELDQLRTTITRIEGEVEHQKERKASLGKEIDKWRGRAVASRAQAVKAEARVKELEEDQRKTREEDGIKCFACPECGCLTFNNEDALGYGFRLCSQCSQEWWIHIDYSLTTRQRYDQLKYRTQKAEADSKRYREAIVPFTEIDLANDSVGEDWPELLKIWENQKNALKDG